jgi:membrane dipeptidase
MSIPTRIDALHAPGLIDLHYDLGMDLYEKRHERGVLKRDYLADLRAGGIGVIGAAIFLEDHYLPEMALRVALGQIARLRAEVEDAADDFAICVSAAEIDAARAAGKVALLITLEGVEPLGTDPDLLAIFHALGVRAIGLTHVRRNMAGEGGLIAPRGSSPQGLTGFGKSVVAACQRLGILVDLAHINPAGFDDILALTTGPVIVSHSNARRYFDIERNLSDDQIRAIGARGGVIGVNSVLVSPTREGATLDRYVDHIEHMVSLAGIGSVAIGFDFFERIYQSLPPLAQASLPDIHFVPGLSHHGHARNVTAKLIARGWRDEDIARFLHGNWMRVIREAV